MPPLSTQPAQEVPLTPLLVIPTRDSGSNETLRWTLRAWEQAHPDIEVLLIGGKPSWYTGQHLATHQQRGLHQVWAVNIPRAIDAALAYAHSNDIKSFWLTHDDTIPLRGGLPLQRPVTWVRSSSLSAYIKRTQSRTPIGYTGAFEKGMQSQYRIIRELGITTDFNADCHMPHLLHVNRLEWLMDLLTKRYPLHPRGHYRAIYGALWPGTIVRRPDPKLLHRTDRIDPDADWVSLASSSWAGWAGKEVRERFPWPSKWEKKR